MVENGIVEGMDISAVYMDLPDNEPSKLADVFRGSTVFMTGATGFLGKLTLEKLLRSCPELDKIYITMRSKKGKDVETRRKELFDCEIFNPLKRVSTKFMDKVRIIPADLTEPNLGMTDEDIKEIVSEVNFVFHIAATVRFDEKLRTAVAINVKATKDLLRMAREMKYLKAFVHVSTAYSNCPRKHIDETFYEPPIKPDGLIDIVNALDDKKLEGILPTILGEWPNTYALTKAIGEDVVKSESRGLPVAMVRPSIVTSTLKEPLCGWIDNIYGATGVVMGAGIGLIRSLHCDPDVLADIVPADYVINCIIAAAWDVAANTNNEKVKDVDTHDPKGNLEDPKIYNYVSAPEKPLTWGNFKANSYNHAMPIPSTLCIWYYCFTLNPNPYVHMLYVFLLHTIPAYTVDFAAKCLGRKPRLVKGYQKIGKFTKVISYFATNQWYFTNKNTQSLWQKLSITDKKLFPFSMRNVDWDLYFYTYIRGGRVYLLKDPLNTVAEGAIWYRKLKIAHYIIVTLISLLLLKLVYILCNFIIGLFI